MEIQNNFKLKIKPYEWIYLVATVVIIILFIRGDIQLAVGILKDLIPKPK